MHRISVYVTSQLQRTCGESVQWLSEDSKLASERKAVPLTLFSPDRRDRSFICLMTTWRIMWCHYMCHNVILLYCSSEKVSAWAEVWSARVSELVWLCSSCESRSCCSFPLLYACSLRFTAPLTSCLSDVHILLLKRAETGVKICTMTFLFLADVCWS